MICMSEDEKKHYANNTYCMQTRFIDCNKHDKDI